MTLLGLLLVPVVASLAAAKKCTNASVPVTVCARNGVFGKVPVPQTSLDATTFIQNLSQQGRNYSQVGLTGYQTIEKTYVVSTQYCVPDNDHSSNPTVQILTHGIGFDKGYWDFPANDFNYSYVDSATDANNFHTLSYDRLGIGLSSHGEPRDEIQATLEVAALLQLTIKLRTGTFPGAKHTYKKVIHVGHSFGSGQTFTLANLYPGISDAIVLTGFGVNSSFIPIFQTGGNFQQANALYPARFGNATVDPAQRLPNGYLISGNAEADQLLFFLPGFFDPAVAAAAEATKQPVTIGELLTLGSLPPVNKYAGPVLVLTGQNDVPFCGGDCLAIGNSALSSIPTSTRKAFPNVPEANFTTYIQPNTAHGINLHYNSTGAYQVIQDFVKGKGLGSS